VGRRLEQHSRSCSQLGHLAGAKMKNTKSDPTVDCLRVRNLLDDLIDLDSDILIWSLDNNSNDMPENLSDRYVDVLETAKRLGLLPDGIRQDFTNPRR
jgi:hypothetical protein